MHSLSAFAATTLTDIHKELVSESEKKCSVLTPCGQENVGELLSAARNQSADYAKRLSRLCALSHEAMKMACRDPPCSFAWRSFYTDAALVWSFLDILNGGPEVTKTEKYWTDIIGRLDAAIIIAGAPVEERLDLVLNTIQRIQAAYMPPHPASPDIVIPPSSQKRTDEKQELLPSAFLRVPVLSIPPSLSAFRSTFSHAPFIIRNFAADWPAIRERKAARKAYLQGVSGRGRVVPIEIGRDYRTDDWAQRLMEWDEFLDYLFSDVEPNAAGQGEENHQRTEKETRYLAQHDLFKQFPLLRGDVVIPDYVYASLPPPDHYPQYRPPGNDEELVLNVWIGPGNTYSPAHTDPFFNIYTQIVGRKTVWLAPPSVSNALLPRSMGLGQHNIDSSGNRKLDRSPKYKFELSGEEAIKGTETPSSASELMLSNTTHLDVFAPSSDLQTEFMDMVAPHAMSAVLDEADALFFPPGWWHAFRSESTSFSVSMWF